MNEKYLQGQLTSIAATLAMLVRSGDKGFLKTLQEAREKYSLIIAESETPRPFDKGVADMVEQITQYVANPAKKLAPDTSNFGYDKNEEGF